jgi:CheY-like chemotaxis protein
VSLTPTVLIVAGDDITHRLQRTVLWRRNIERVQVKDAATACEKVRTSRPRLVVVDGRDADKAAAVMQQLRNDPETRSLSLAAVVDDVVPGTENQLRQAGANVVLSGQAVPFLWDQWLEELLTVPPRRAARIAVRLEVWQRRVGQPGPRIGWTVNISTRGILLETIEPMEVGTTLDMMFRLPDDEHHALRPVGQIVRHTPGTDATSRSGIKFLRITDVDKDRIAVFAGPDV